VSNCENYYKNAAPLSSSNSCDPGNKMICYGEAFLASDDSAVSGYCAGTTTNPNPDSQLCIIIAVCRSQIEINKKFRTFGV